MTTERPCKYCVANYRGMHRRTGSNLSEILPTADDCEWAHRDDPRVYDLARAFAKVFQSRHPTDEQIAWFLEDADEVVDDFDPPPDKWRVRRLPARVNDGADGVDCRALINGVKYVMLEGGKGCRGSVVALATHEAHRAEANR